MKAYDTLKTLVDGIAEDIVKSDAGNRSAKTRVRKAMMSIKAAAQEVRTGVLGKPVTEVAEVASPAIQNG